jgi:hypothetical protein
LSFPIDTSSGVPGEAANDLRIISLNDPMADAGDRGGDSVVRRGHNSVVQRVFQA